jgi:hypothetical protein
MRARRAAGIALKLRMGLATRKLGILRPDSFRRRETPKVKRGNLKCRARGIAGQDRKNARMVRWFAMAAFSA